MCTLLSCTIPCRYVVPFFSFDLSCSLGHGGCCTSWSIFCVANQILCFTKEMIKSRRKPPYSNCFCHNIPLSFFPLSIFIVFTYLSRYLQSFLPPPSCVYTHAEISHIYPSNRLRFEPFDASRIYIGCVYTLHPFVNV